MKPVRYLILALCIVYCLLSMTSSFAASAPIEMLLRLRSNVVLIEVQFVDGKKENGKGFIVGVRSDSAFIVTAGHVLVDNLSVGNNCDSIIVFYYGYESRRVTATLCNLDTQNDLGTITAPIPTDFDWEMRCLASPREIRTGGEVWTIGGVGNWVLEYNNGGILEYDRVAGTVGASLPYQVAGGMSGSPLIGRDGIIGMIIESSGGHVVVRSIDRIREIVSRKWGYPWNVQEYQPGKGLFVGINVGAGYAGFLRDDVLRQSSWVTAFRLGLVAGFALTNRLLISMESDLLYRRTQALVYMCDDYIMAATYYWGYHTYTKAGVALSLSKAEPLSLIKRETGVGPIGGLGLEYFVGEHLAIGPSIEYHYHKMDRFSTNEISVQFNATWY